MSFAIVNASILDQPVDAIVNPANQFLQHGGGLARIIADAATRPFDSYDPDVQARLGNEHPIADLHRERASADQSTLDWIQDHENTPLIPVGSASMTCAGRLPFKGVIHAVGPVWGGGTLHEVSLLRSAYDQAFAVAEVCGFESVAVPAIGMGIFGIPKEVVARVATSSARQYAHKIDITICLTSDEDVALFEAYR
jgi:O-acetyl-ADP-ribose deacetylase (regulator of RNase III)